jgi:lipopolysaccharide export LptBFGC system permease protein LptF
MSALGFSMARTVLTFPLMALALTACVTINIYFPAAAAEEAARTIVRDVLKSEQAEPAPPAEGDDKQSSVPAASPVLVAFGRMLEVLVPPAEAAQAGK